MFKVRLLNQQGNCYPLVLAEAVWSSPHLVNFKFQLDLFYKLCLREWLFRIIVLHGPMLVWPDFKMLFRPMAHPGAKHFRWGFQGHTL